MKTAILQVASHDNETQEQRTQRVSDWIASLPEVDLIMLPELWATGYFNFSQYRDRSEQSDGHFVATLTQLAVSAGSYIHIGSFIERTLDNKLKNTSMLISPAGDIVHQYSKIHVFGYESQEARLITPGDELMVTETPLGRFSGTTCYDLRFPGLWQQLSDRGATIVCVPAAWPAARLEHWKLFTSTRAVEHQMFIIACNAAGTQSSVKLAGHSRIIAPTGDLLCECSDKEEHVIVDLDLSLIERTRSEFPVIADRLKASEYHLLR